LFPQGYPWLVEPRSPKRIAEALATILTSQAGLPLRNWYLARFTSAHYAENMKRALRLAET